MKNNNLHYTITLKTILFAFLLCLSGMTTLFAQSISQGAVSGHAFTVNADGDQVLFSKGNLQYIGSAVTPYWKFADNQWDYYGSTTGQNSDDPNVDRDLFGWGTSGYNHGSYYFQPWSTNDWNERYRPYGSEYSNLYNQTGQADWGYNAIRNGGNTENSGWRTLRVTEWNYVFDTRNTSSGIRYAKARVDNVDGVILLPDDWNSSYYTLNSINTSNAHYNSNTITVSQWNTLEQHGAVFLPRTGYRYGTNFASGGGYYWSADRSSNAGKACIVDFSDYDLDPWDDFYRSRGCSVRLVCPAQIYSFGINATPNSAEGGSVSGGGVYGAGVDCTLTAIPSSGYTFVNWIENGSIVSTNATYTFTVYHERTLVANFVQEGNIAFADANVKTLCVANWDSNNDGELNYAEAAAVTSLDNVFKNNTNIHSFNELQYFTSLGSIGEQTFYGCSELTQVTIPTGVASIGDKAFWNCPALQTVRFNAINCTSMHTTYNSQTYSVFSEDATGSASNVKSVILGPDAQRIPDYAFNNCVDIYPGLTIRNSVTEIGAHAFEGCSSMTNLAFQSNSNLATIGDYAFNGCSALNKALNLPNSVTTVGEYAFYGCVAIPSLTIGTSMESIGGYAFWNCPAMATVTFNATNCSTMVTDSQYSVFNSGTGNGVTTPIVTLNIGNNVTRIPDFAFQNSTNITHAITIPNTTTYIGSYAFYGCFAIPSLTIGEGVTTIGGYAFWNCPNLATVNFNAANCSTMITDSQYSVFNSGTSNSDPTPIVTLSIGNNVTMIPDYAFCNSTNLTSAIMIPNATTTIGTYAFYGCISISSLTIGEGVTSVGGWAFYNCPALTTVNFNATNCTTMQTGMNSSVFSSGTNGGSPPIVTLNIGENVTNIPNYAFKRCDNLTCDITIPDAVTSIGTYAFGYCSGHNVTIGNGVTNISNFAFYSSAINGTLLLGNSIITIGERAFEGCSGLSGELSIPNSVVTISSWSFKGCSGFTGNLVIPNSVTTLAYEAFGDCSGFDGVLTLPENESFTTIGSSAFRGCSGLSGTLTIPANVTIISASAFAGCSSFTGALVLHDAMTSIGNSAFYGCSNLSELIIGNGVTSIGDYAFYGCYNLSEVTIGNGVTSIGDYAFWNCPNMATVHFNAANCTSMTTNSQYPVFNSGTSDDGATPIVTLTIGENVTSIPAFAFRYSNNMTCDIHIPDAVTSIGTYAFANCSGNDVSIGNGVANINDYAFYQSAGFNGTLTLGNALANIGQNAFQGCSGFTGDLVIPNSITTLGEYAFEGCSGFDGSLVIGRGIQTINESTFANCSGFSGALILGTQVNSIGKNAFQNCSAFALVISENPNPITATSSSFTAMNYSIPVYVPDGLVSNYQNATGWNNFTNYIEQYTFWDNLDSANWSDEMNWLSMELPTANDVVCITYNCDLDIDFDVLYVYVYNINDVLTIKAGQTLYTTYGVGLEDPSQLVIETGGQVIIGDETNNATQTVALGTGFNWVSACVETNLDDLKAALLTALPNASSLKINSQSNGYTNYSGSRWRGTMNTWDASQMYIIEVPEACEITLTGAPIRPEDHPVSMAPGNNWIAFPLNTSMSVTDAFSGFPINGDKVSSQSNGFTNYTNRWRGTLGTLEAGKGYIYNSASTENRSFIFPVNAEKTMKGLVR